MLMASELRVGLAVRIESALYKIIEVTHHAGQGKMGGFTHAKLRHLEAGTTREWRFRADEPLEDVMPERQNLQFPQPLHAPGDVRADGHREHPAWPRRQFLTDAMTVPIEFIDAHPIGIVLPDVLEVKVAHTAPPARSHGGTNVWKEVRLENGVTVMAPPFIASGEMIRVDVKRGTYVERAHKK